MRNNPQQAPMDGERLLRLRDVLQIVRVGKSTWWRWCAEGYAPRPIHLGKRTTVWRASDVQRFIERAGKQ